MSTTQLSLTFLICFLHILVPMSFSCVASNLSAFDKAEANWPRVIVEGEEISFLLPAKPSILVKKGDSYLRIGSERITGERLYSIYDDGIVFIVHSYAAAKPSNLLDDLLDAEGLPENKLLDVVVDGIAGKESHTDDKDYYRCTRYFVARKHLYSVIVATRGRGDDAAVQRFLSSMRFGRADLKDVAPNSIVIKSPDKNSAPDKTLPNSSPVFNREEVTKKAVILWKTEPDYTEEARLSNIGGTIKLRAVLSASGQVTNVEVVTGLKAGLTEKAIEAVKQIRFLPAEKDGRAVSQYIEVEFGFAVYD